MSALGIVVGIVNGVAELVKLGKLAASDAREAEEVLVRNMKPTPPSKEIDDYRASYDRLKASARARGDVSPMPTADASSPAPADDNPYPSIAAAHDTSPPSTDDVGPDTDPTPRPR